MRCDLSVIQPDQNCRTGGGELPLPWGEPNRNCCTGGGELPLPWGEGWGEGIRSLRNRTPSPAALRAATSPHGPVSTAAQAEQVVQLYRLRWRIEQIFRALKSDGLALDDSSTHRRRTHVQSRCHRIGWRNPHHPARGYERWQSTAGNSTSIDATFAVALERLSKKLEGKTARQKNPHPADSLAFVAWIAARTRWLELLLQPPGPKTDARWLEYHSPRSTATPLLSNQKIRQSRSPTGEVNGASGAIQSCLVKLQSRGSGA